MKFDKKTGLRKDGSKGHLMVVGEIAFINGELSPLVTEDGFKIVATAVGGSDTPCLYNEQCENIDLLLIELDIPNQDGIALLEKILAVDSEARVIVIVSEDRTALVRQALAVGAKNFIVKPLKKDSVLVKIRAVIRK